jgi:hypothetical protein
MTRSPVSRNEGIQATTVTAEVLAVGHGARAIKHAAPPDTEALSKAVAQLRDAVAALELPHAAQEVLQRDVQGLAETAASGVPDERKAETHLHGIADKLKMVGLVLHDVVGLAEPVSKIAALLRIPLTFLTGV